MAITVKSDFWGNNYSMISDKSNFRKIIARLLNLGQNKRDRALLNALVGAAPGGTATATQTRIAHNRLELGGKRTMETETFVNRATTSADVTDLKAKLLTYNSRANLYPTDKAKKP